MSGIFQAIFGALFSTIARKIQEWFNQKRLEAAESKAEALKGYLKSLEEANATEQKMKQVSEEIEAKYSEAKTYQEKLDVLRKQAEERRTAKIKSDLEGEGK